jgi:pSer/pThr/pTyr-binding forkhead associated (FHA) protein
MLPPGSIVTIGRHADREIVLHDDRVSRNHARITVRDGDLLVEDLGSGNGTHLAGQPIRSSAWAPGQELVIGHYAFRFERGNAHQTRVMRRTPE